MLQLEPHEVAGHGTLLVLLGKTLRDLGDLALDDCALEVDGLGVNVGPELPSLGNDLMLVVEGRHPVLLHPVAIVQALGEEGWPTEPGEHRPMGRLLVLGNIIESLHSGYISVNLTRIMNI